MFPPRTLAAGVVAGALLLPAAASAMPIDSGRPAPHRTAPAAPPPLTRTVVETSDDTVAIAVAGAALLVALASAGYSARRPTPA